MDAQATAQDKWKVGAGGPVRALSQRAYTLALESLSELETLLTEEAATRPARTETMAMSELLDRAKNWTAYDDGIMTGYLVLELVQLVEHLLSPEVAARAEALEEEQ